MENLTRKEVLKWAKGDRLDCPRCGPTSESTLDYDSYDYEDWTVWQNVTCTRCGIEFQVIFEFTKIDVNMGEGPVYSVVEKPSEKLVIEIQGGNLCDVYYIDPKTKRKLPKDVKYILRDHDNIAGGDPDPLPKGGE